MSRNASNRRDVLLQVRRELKQQRAELRAERRRRLEELAHAIAAVAQPRVVRDPLGRLQRQPELFRRRPVPAVENLLVRRAVERVVDLDGRRTARRSTAASSRPAASRDRSCPSTRDSCSRTFLPRSPFDAPFTRRATEARRDTETLTVQAGLACAFSEPRVSVSLWPVAVKVARLEGMLLKSAVAVALVAMLAGCSRAPAAREYELNGPDPRDAARGARGHVQHEDIKGSCRG